ALAQLFRLQQFALDHLLRQVNEDVKDAEVAFLDGDLESLHVEPVAGKHAFGVAPPGVGRGTAAARLGFVNNVVVNQRGGVDDLHHGAQAPGAALIMGKELGGKQ